MEELAIKKDLAVFDALDVDERWRTNEVNIELLICREDRAIEEGHSIKLVGASLYCMLCSPPVCRPFKPDSYVKLRTSCCFLWLLDCWKKFAA